jgi:4-amino-4-deoxy-L-arabinose transferase-like glycosyltransferase
MKPSLRSAYLPIIITLFFALALGYFIALDYGVSWDEVGIYRYASRMLGAYQFILHPAEFDSFDPDPLLNLYGPAHFMYVAVVSRFILAAQPSWTPDAAAHFTYFTTFLFGTFLLYLLAQRWMSEWAAFGISLLFLTQPLLWGHAFTNPKDTPFMTFFIASIYFGFRMMDNSNWKKIIAAGIVLGLTTSIRALGPMAGAIVILYGLWKSPRKALTIAPFYLLLAGAITWLLWPYLWKAPIANLLDSLQIMSKFPNTGETLFMGKLYPADQLPLIYFPTFIILQLTEPALLFIAIGAAFSIKEKKWEAVSLFAIWFLLPALYIGFSGSTLYDNARQLIFLLPPLFIFAGISVDALLARVKSLPLLSALALIMLLPGIYAIIQLHPYQYIYFNSLTGGVSGAFRKFDLDYSGTSLKEAQAYLNAHAESNAQTVILGPRPSARFYARPDLQDKIFSPHDVLNLRAGEYYYFVYLTRTNADLNRCNGQTIYAIERDGGVLAYIKKVTSEEKCW